MNATFFCAFILKQPTPCSALHLSVAFPAVPPAAGVPVTGAASSSRSTALILQVMTQAVIMTLGDTAVQHIPDSQQQQQQQKGALVLGSSSSSSNVSSSADALALLQQLSLQASSSSSNCQQPSNHSQADRANGSSNSAAATPPGPQQQQQQQEGPSGAPGSFTVHQDEAWLAASSSRVQALLAMTLPRLLTHPQPAVRKALAQCAAQLLSGVTRALRSSRQAMLEILLTLANDEYEQVSQVAVAALQGQSAGSSSRDAGTAAPDTGLADSLAAAMAGAVHVNVSGNCVTNSSSSSGVVSVVGRDLLLQLCVEVPAGVRRGEASGTAAAKRAAAAVLCAGGCCFVHPPKAKTQSTPYNAYGCVCRPAGAVQQHLQQALMLCTAFCDLPENKVYSHCICLHISC
jgi:hypothetical protein